MDTISLAIILLVCWQFSTVSQQLCSHGHRLQTTTDGLGVCVLCEDGVTFMPTEKHTNKNCYNCTRIEYPDLEIMARECNISHDSEIVCQKGYYRYKARNNREMDKCEKCTHCKDLLRVCGEYQDSLCCPENHVSVVVRNGVAFCKKIPTVCGAGQYFNQTTEMCLSCPKGTYMYESNHTHTSCSPCAAPVGDPTFYSVVVQECNITSPTVFGCKDRYFRSNLEPLTVEVKCSPCQQCQREVSQCDMYHDAICYGNDHVTQETVVLLKSVSSDTIQEYSQIPTTQDTNTCGHGYYLHINTSDGSTSCQSCDHLQLEGHSRTGNLSQIFTDQISPCPTTIQKYRIYSIILFILASLIDILFIFLYSRHFLKKTSNFLRRNPTANSDKTSHVFGTIAMDVHFVLTFVHLFGILCEAGVISMNEDILWTFTIAVVVTSLFLYFADAAVFLYVKQIIFFPACFHRKCQNTSRHDDDGDGDDDNLTIIESEVI